MGSKGEGTLVKPSHAKIWGEGKNQWVRGGGLTLPRSKPQHPGRLPIRMKNRATSNRSQNHYRRPVRIPEQAGK